MHPHRIPVSSWCVAEPAQEAWRVLSDTDIDAAIGELETEMEYLQLRHRDMFSFANAWAERYDAIIAQVSDPMRESVEKRLHRVGVRWGMATGMRMTGQFPALKLTG